MKLRLLDAGLLLARDLPIDTLPELLGEIEVIRTMAFARLTTPTVEAKPDRLVDVVEASDRMHVSKDFLYRNHKRYPFTRREGRRLLFSSNGLDRHLKKGG